MKQFHSPWFDFPVPNESVLVSDLELADKAGDKKTLAKLTLAVKLREMADYTVFLPELPVYFFSDKQRDRIISSGIKKSTDPNFYLKNGKKVTDSKLFDAIQTFTIPEASNRDLPSILFSIDAISGGTLLFDTLFEQKNYYQLLYWLYKTKLMDNDSKRVSSLAKALYETDSNLTRKLLQREAKSFEEYTDIVAIEDARNRVMYHSEEAYFQTVLYDRLGFFGSLSGLTNPSYKEILASSAYATDNRRNFQTKNLPEFVKTTALLDYINFRFVVVQIGTVDFLEVEWRFPKAEQALINKDANFDYDELVKLYAQI